MKLEDILIKQTVSNRGIKTFSLTVILVLKKEYIFLKESKSCDVYIMMRESRNVLNRMS